MKAKIILCFLLALGLAGSAFGQDEGSTSSNHLLVPLTARTVGMGTALTSGLTTMNAVEAGQANPASYSLNTNTSVLFSRMDYVADIGVNFLGFAQQIGNGTLAVTVNSWDFGDIALQEVDNPEPTATVFEASAFTLGVGYARQMTDRIAAGISLKMATETIDDMSQNRVVFDAGMSYAVGESGLRFGVSLQNFGAAAAFEGSGFNRFAKDPNQPDNTSQSNFSVRVESFEAPSTLTFGASYTASLAGDLNATFAGNYASSGFGPDAYTGGLELGYRDLFYVRGGYQAFSSTDVSMYSGLAYGAGLNLDLGGLGLSVDYAYRATDYFSAPQIITVGVEL
jgi:hypothetical protein